MLKILIADDHPSVRLNVRKMFDRVPDFQVIGEASNGLEAIELVEKSQPDVLVLDMQMPVMDGFEVLSHLKKCKSSVRTIILSAHNEPIYIAEVMSLGAWGYYLKEDAPSTLVEAVRQAGRGDGQGTRPRPSPKLIQKLASSK
jgi:DNA-binding NarL/FixJ family response regulator